MKVAEIADRSGVYGFGKIENKELTVSQGINHVMGLAIEVLDADSTSAKIKILQFSCLKDEICLGNFECTNVGVCAAPGASCIIDRDCSENEICDAGVCTDTAGLNQNQETTNLCRLKTGETSYCAYDGKTYQVTRTVGCKFVISSDEVAEEEFVLGPLETKEFSNGIIVKRDIYGCGTQYLTLRFEGGSGEPVTSAPCFIIQNNQCVGVTCSTYESSSITVYEFESECQAALSGQDAFCDYGCFEEGNCYPIGYRKSGKYCGPNNAFLNQKTSDDYQSVPCENNFECSSNLCVDENCVSSGFVQSLIEFFRSIFSQQ